MTQHPAPRRLVVFARDPVVGRVKTRLIPAVGGAAATALYWELLHATLATAGQVSRACAELWLDHPAPQRAALELAARHGMAVRTQQGGDIGSRMASALSAAPGCPALLIGTDCPGYTVDYLEAAFTALADRDAVIGPAVDGGYVLIGLARPRPALFEGIAWGTPQVLDATRARLVDLGLCWHELPTLRDLDRPDDLQHFPHLAARAGIAGAADPAA